MLLHLDINTNNPEELKQVITMFQALLNQCDANQCDANPCDANQHEEPNKADEPSKVAELTKATEADEPSKVAELTKATEVIDPETVRGELIKLASVKSKEVARQILDQFGAAKFTDVKPEDYPELLKRCIDETC